LPARPAGYTSAAQQFGQTLFGIPGPSAHLDADWPPFEDPPLLGLDGAARAIAIARVVALVWAATVVSFALRVRSSVAGGESTVYPSIDPLARAGLLVVASVAVTGWLWSDRATRNVRRLEGRHPTRGRCVVAWSLPLASAALLWLTVLRMDPTEGFDVRPTIVVTLMALTIWRPYSLIRRIVASLRRARYDMLIRPAYIFDLFAFGLLWWQLARWPSPGTPVTAGHVNVLLGVSAAASVCLALNIGAWTWLTHNVRVAETDRVNALRTRHDHRHLRLRGINPMDPDIRFALLRIRQEEELEHVLEVERQEVAARSEPNLEVPIAVKTKPKPRVYDDRPSVPVGPLVTEIISSNARHEIIADLVAQISSAETKANKRISDMVGEVADEAEPQVAGVTMGQFAAALSRLPTRESAPTESDPEGVGETTIDVVEHETRRAS
jgi:hypothetical protein